jgi:hypothetical protein
MALTYSIVDYRGKAAEPILEELLFTNKTVNEGLVTFDDQVKAETIFTEATADVTMQAYTSGAPTASGGTTLFDTAVTPTKVMYYTEFDPNTLRPSRFKRDMAAGAWENLSNEFEQIVIGGLYANKISADVETKYWSGVKSATKTAIAALTPGAGQTSVGAAEQTLVASLTATEIDGVVAKMIYNDSNAAHTAALGGRIKVSGTTISSSNIKSEYDKLYAAAPAVVIAAEDGEAPFIYVPRSHKQFINIYNNNPANYKDAFSVSEDKTKYFYNGVEVKFVPVPENVMILSKKSHLFWCTDLASDISTINVDKIANNREDRFVKAIMTCAAHVGKQSLNVLYVG